MKSVCSLLLTGFLTVTFFLSTAIAQEPALPIDDSPGLTPQQECFVSDLAYQDPTIEVSIEKGRAYNTDYWVAYIKIACPTQLRTAAAGTFDSNRTTSGKAIAKRMHAVLAINGDYFCYTNYGYLIRQGTLYRKIPDGVRDVLMVDAQGDFHIVQKATIESLAQYTQMDIINSFNFGPALVIDGERIQWFSDNENAAKEGRQRMAIAQLATGSLEYIAVCTAGPYRGNAGMTLSQFSSILFDLGAENAYNLDGGNSTMMIFNYEYVNTTSMEAMREISDIIYFASAYEP